MAERSTEPEALMFVERRHRPAYEADVVARAGGDDVLARKLLGTVKEHWAHVDREYDLAARDAWFQKLAAWDGSDPAWMAKLFVADAALFFSTVKPPKTKAAERDLAESVRIAFERTRATEPYKKNPGRALLSAGLRALDVSNDDIDDTLDKFRKPKKKR